MGRTSNPRRAATNGRGQADPAKEPGYSRLAQLLRDEILEGRVSAGARLKVSEIAQRYGTSINPVREALQVLEGEGFITIAPNRGASVKELSEELVHNIFDIRILFASYFVRGFVESATPEEVAALRGHQEACEKALLDADGPAFQQSNLLFHGFIVDHHFNDEAMAILRKHDGWLQAMSRKTPLNLAQIRRSVAEHWRIIEAVENGDPDAAARAIEEHLRSAYSVFRDRMRRQRQLLAG